jgi:hypothetical protein
MVTRLAAEETNKVNKNHIVHICNLKKIFNKRRMKVNSLIKEE